MADEEIPLIPKIPDGLREAAQLGFLIPFVGAGASQLAGCPGWASLAAGALESIVAAGHLNYAQVKQLDGVSARVKLSVMRALQRTHSIKIDFRKLVQPDGGKSDPKGRRLY
jgi:hypothetical protein